MRSCANVYEASASITIRHSLLRKSSVANFSRTLGEPTLTFRWVRRSSGNVSPISRRPPHHLRTVLQSFRQKWHLHVGNVSHQRQLSVWILTNTQMIYFKPSDTAHSPRPALSCPSLRSTPSQTPEPVRPVIKHDEGHRAVNIHTSEHGRIS